MQPFHPHIDTEFRQPKTDTKRFRYDGMGNILNLYRNGTASVDTSMDDLTYHYTPRTNQLEYVDDAISSAIYTVDIDDQSAGNYAYDPIGNLIQDNAEGITNIDWTVFNKIKRIERSGHTDIIFNYGPDRQRISKTVEYDNIGTANDSTVTTFYVYALSGRVLATYQQVDYPLVTSEFYLIERSIYGDKRLGYREERLDLLNTPVPTPDADGIIYVERGRKKYQLENYQGTVISVISDRRKGMSCSSGYYSYYEADILMAADYFSMGQQIPDREFSSDSYRYGFSSKEKDNEVKGSGNTYDFGDRIFDPRLGRFLSLDPYKNKFPSFSPYSYAGNSPLWAIDIAGDSIYILFYTVGNHSGDELFKASALTRKHDITNSGHFNPMKDVVLLYEVKDVSDIQFVAEAAVLVYSGIYGKTAEVGIFSHSGHDGPIGTTSTTYDPILEANSQGILQNMMQMTLDGWAKIDFNWAENAKAVFYGCNSGHTNDQYPSSFTTNISALDNFKGVDVWGQTASSSPSNAPNSLSIDLNIIEGNYPLNLNGDGLLGHITSNWGTEPEFDKTYMVGKKSAINYGTFIFGGSAEPMSISKNGVERGCSYQPGNEED